MSARPLSDDEWIVDNFAGGGGASTGIALALGRHPDVAINHSPEAVALHRANHPTTLHLCQNVWKADPSEVVPRGKKVGLAWFSPDCFPAGTLVLTRDGYRPIEQIAVGDEVLTHQRRWRRVVETHRAVRPLIRLRGHGHPGLLVSPEHPFYARPRDDLWNNARRSYERTLRPAAWVPASMLDKGWYWAAPTEFPADAPPPVPVYRSRAFSLTADLMWLAGRYVADGWTRLTETRAEVVITCGTHEVEWLRERLAAWGREGTRAGADEFAWHERATGTAYQFTTNSRGLVEWLREQFGHGAAEKRIPGWALGMDEGLRRALLDGYLSGDGWRGTNHASEIVEAGTVSKALAFGVKALASSLGFTPTVYLAAQTNGVIDGRAVNTLPSWRVKWRPVLDDAHRQTFREEGMEWAPIREQEDTGTHDEVFNIGVDEDESYIVEGIVVHNCRHFSKAKGGAPVKRNVRDLAWVVVLWARTVKPRVLMIENVEEFTTWGPLGEDGRPCPARSGTTFRRWIGELKRLGYAVEWRELRACDYGAPTIRKRLFVVARCDGQPIVWPAPTHGPGTGRDYRTAAECIDWSIPTPSIFERDRPLADATLRRIAHGIKRFCVDAANPYIVSLAHQGSLFRGQSVDDPMNTVTAATLAQTGYGEREGQAPRAMDVQAPLGTVVAAGGHALVAAFMAQHNGGVVGRSMDDPMSTLTTGGSQQQPVMLELSEHDRARAERVTAFLVKFYGTAIGQGLDVKFYGTAIGQGLDEPLHTATTKARFGLICVRGVPIVDIGMRMLQPRELFNAQGFPADYEIETGIGPDGEPVPLTKTAQIRACGNAVSPPLAEALARANLGREAITEEIVAA